MILKNLCKECGKVLEVKHTLKFPAFTLNIYKCGHSTKELPEKDKEAIAVAIDVELISQDRKSPFEFQVTGAKFAVKSGVRCLIIDEQGLGKTIQALMTVNALSKPQERSCIHCNGSGEISFSDDTKGKCKECDGIGSFSVPSTLPVLAIVKTKLKMQWMKEVQRWCKWPSQIIESEDAFVIPGLPVYIVSAHSLSHITYTNKKGKQVNKGFKDIAGWCKTNDIKTIILDEAQIIKNHDAKVTNSIRKAVKDTPYFIGLSGTPIKNHAGEYFPLLNLVRPDKFPSLNHYEQNWCSTYWDGYRRKKGGLKDAEKFKAFTSDFIIRRTREEVLPDLPRVNRTPRFSELGAVVQTAYDAELKRFVDYFDSSEDVGNNFVRQSNILAYLSRMRHLTGLSKVDGAVDFITDFVNETSRKFCLFAHHKDVTQLIVSKLELLRRDWPFEWGQGILEIKSGMSDLEINDTTQKFYSKDYRILVASTLAAGEGFNLQCCSDFGMLERQWNPANEEQAESRFPRPGQEADKITGTYFIAVGTIDEFFADLVERKRSMMKSVLDQKDYVWQESDLIKELSETLAASGRKKWSY